MTLAPERFKASCMRTTWVIVCFGYIYLATYAILMDPRIPVLVDSPTGKTVTRTYSAYRFAPIARVAPPPSLTVFLPTTTWLNTVFLPVEKLRNELGTEPLGNAEPEPHADKTQKSE
jgi:hypothetical protein